MERNVRETYRLRAAVKKTWRKKYIGGAARFNARKIFSNYSRLYTLKSALNSQTDNQILALTNYKFFRGKHCMHEYIYVLNSEDVPHLSALRLKAGKCFKSFQNLDVTLTIRKVI